MNNREALTQAIMERVRHESCNVPVSMRLTQSEYEFVEGLAKETGTNISKILHALIREAMGE